MLSHTRITLLEIKFIPCNLIVYDLDLKTKHIIFKTNV